VPHGALIFALHVGKSLHLWGVTGPSRGGLAWAKNRPRRGGSAQELKEVQANKLFSRCIVNLDQSFGVQLSLERLDAHWKAHEDMQTQN
jgi:hypothetical protein